jgi:hypothetical protein
MPKESGERVRVREKEAAYIRQVAEQYQESFLDALYRIVNFHRDTQLGVAPISVKSKKVVKPDAIEPQTPEIETDLDDLNLEMFE